METTALQEAVEGIQHGHGKWTNTGAAINYALDSMITPAAGSRPGVSKVIIVITDGRSQKWQKTQAAAKRGHDQNMTIFAIGVGRNLDLNELSNIASNPDDEFLFMVDDFSALQTITNRLARTACKISTPAPFITTTNAPSDQSDCGGKPADVFFLIDSSGSITRKDFNKEISFVQSVVKLFDVAMDKTRIGLISFSHDANIVLPLDSLMSKEEVLNKLSNIPHVGGGTNTAEALKLARQQGFSADVVRPNVPKLIIVLTDGLSRDEIQTAREARLAQAMGIKAFAIGIGRAVDMVEIRNIASNPDQQYVFQVEDFSSLETIKDVLADKACGVKPDEARKPDPRAVCLVKKNTDMMFIYDSTSMGVRTSNAISQFLSKVVSGLDLRSGNLRIGRVTDDCPTAGNIPLSSKLTPVDFSEFQLSSYSHMLQKLRRSGFTIEYGGRQGATKLAVLFIDGNMNGLDYNIINEAKLLKAKNNNVFVVTIGNGDIISKIGSEFGQGYHMHVNDYRSLENAGSEFLSQICDFFTFDSLDYNIDYVIPV
ncbi:cartilage matrix protein-like isoform X2 [Mya arenaria]|nr:cartilage matrix protein-like isoform X2 [Mya arenaria]